jgi:hypothetical protein
MADFEHSVYAGLLGECQHFTVGAGYGNPLCGHPKKRARLRSLWHPTARIIF